MEKIPDNAIFTWGKMCDNMILHGVKYLIALPAQGAMYR